MDNLWPVGCMRPASDSCAAGWVPRGKKIRRMNVKSTFARVVNVARDKNHNSFSALGSEKVAHHCLKACIKPGNDVYY